MDRRALPGLAAGLAGLAFGVSAAVLSSPGLAVVAAACALAAGGASLVMLERVHRAEREAEESRRRPRRSRERRRGAGHPAARRRDRPARPPLLRARPRRPGRRRPPPPLAGHRRAARRAACRPTPTRTPTAGPGALASFATLLRQTLREADIACRLSGTTMGLILEDTAEEGGVWTAQRLQIALAKDVTRVRRLAAGVASYPSHGLAPRGGAQPGRAGPRPGPAPPKPATASARSKWPTSNSEPVSGAISTCARRDSSHPRGQVAWSR